MNSPNSDELLFLGTGIMGAPMAVNLASAHIQLKDAATADKLAAKLGLDAPFLRLSKNLFAEMSETSRRQLDHSALFLHLKDRRARTTAGDD